MGYKKILLVLLLGIGEIISIQAQDVRFSQFNILGMDLNPASVGDASCLRFSAIHRSMYPIPNRPAVAHSRGFAIDCPVGEKFALGLTYVDFFRGEASFNGQNPGKRTSTLSNRYYKFTMGGEVSNRVGNSRFTWGLNTNFSRIGVTDWSKLVFSDQLDPVLGKISPSQVPLPYSDPFSRVTFDFGAAYYKYFNRSFLANVGLAVFNYPLKRRDNSYYQQSFYYPTTSVYPRWSINGKSFLAPSGSEMNQYMFMWNVYFQTQKEPSISRKMFQGFDVGAMYFTYIVPNYPLFVGATYHNSTFLIDQTIYSLNLQAGIKIPSESKILGNNEARVAIGWDKTFSPMTSTWDNWEISLVILLKDFYDTRMASYLGANWFNRVVRNRPEKCHDQLSGPYRKGPQYEWNQKF